MDFDYYDVYQINRTSKKYLHQGTKRTLKAARKLAKTLTNEDHTTKIISWATTREVDTNIDDTNYGQISF